MNKSRIIYLYILCLSLLGVGCVSDSQPQMEVALPEGAHGLSFELALASGVEVQPMSRAVQELNFNTIDQLDVFLFDAEDGLVRYFPYQNWNLENKEITLVLPDQEAQQVANSRARLVVIANSTWSKDDFASVKSFAQLEQIREHTNFYQTSEQESFLMVAHIPTGQIKWDEQTRIYKLQQTVGLQKVAARVQLNIKEINIIEDGVSYKVVGQPLLRFVNYVDTTHLVKRAEVAQFEQKLSDPIELQWDAASKSYLPSVPLYSYEIDWALPDSKVNTYDSEREAYLSLELKLQAGGKGEKSYYYRIPINYTAPTASMSEQEQEKLFKLERGHFYKVSSEIYKLGSEDPGLPMELDSKIGIYPYLPIDDIDGNISKIDYLVVQEKEVEMAYVNTYDLPYRANADVDVQIDRVWHEQYDRYGKRTIVNKSKAEINNLHISAEKKSKINETGQTLSYIQISSPIPSNNVPWHIELSVRHTTNSKLVEHVHVMQYPDKYVTAKTSTGFSNSYTDPRYPNADFRFHVHIGNSNGAGAIQNNTTLYTVTTLVSSEGDKIGVAVHENGYTKRDAVSNELIAPEFIIASQYGMSPSLDQFEDSYSRPYWQITSMAAGYGPYSSRFNQNVWAYHRPRNPDRVSIQLYYHVGESARTRCHDYFEDEYGTDGIYTEYYINANNRKATRQVQKKFKYQGRWRLPTKAELQYINKIQNLSGSAVEGLLMGSNYWTGQTNTVYNINTGTVNTNYTSKTNVRCVFDSWKLKKER